jgi:hypothetical protein
MSLTNVQFAQLQHQLRALSGGIKCNFNDVFPKIWSIGRAGLRPSVYDIHSELGGV